jgi:acyl dehydratase
VPLDLDAVGRWSEPYTAKWDSTAALLYAVGVGAGVEEPSFTTENTEGVEQQVLPTFPLVIGGGLSTMPDIGSYDFAKLVHGEQRITLHGSVPVEGEVELRQQVVGMYDKGKAAVVASETTATDVTSGAVLFTKYSSSFIVGEGGWGGDRGPAPAPNVAPERAPDVEITYQTSRDQALVYRLSGDRNRLHVDPAFARRGGFDQPILHGLCTYGFTGRALLHGLCGSDPSRFLHMEGRFSAPMLPGDSVTVRMWTVEPGRAVFTASRGDGTVVIDRGALGFAPV